MTPQAALDRLGRALQQAGGAMLEGAFDTMAAALEDALATLCALAQGGHTPVLDTPPHPPWNADQALHTLWQVLAALRQAGCGAFPHAGTLLGLVRDGQLLPHDKDADVGVWWEDFARASDTLARLGFVRARNQPPASNLATWVQAAQGLSVDLFGLRREGMGGAVQRVVGGVWLPGKPASHQRVSHFPPFALVVRDTPAGAVWWPDPAEGLLAALYGDWRTPQPGWNSHISSLAVQSLNLHWRCWGLKAVCDGWLGGNLSQARHCVEQMARRSGPDPLLQACAAALAMTTSSGASAQARP